MCRYLDTYPRSQVITLIISAKFFAASDQRKAIRVSLFQRRLGLLECLIALFLGAVPRRRLYLESGRPFQKLPIRERWRGHKHRHKRKYGDGWAKPRQGECFRFHISPQVDAGQTVAARLPQDNNLRTQADARVQVHNIFVVHANASVRDEPANRSWIVGAVNSVLAAAAQG